MKQVNGFERLSEVMSSQARGPMVHEVWSMKSGMVQSHVTCAEISGVLAIHSAVALLLPRRTEAPLRMTAHE